jgi:two-component system cell cycle response regulator
MNGAPLSVLLLDIDRFKSVNDTYGHAAGDLVLIAFAKRVSEELRGVDLVCRFGGEEFLVITPDADQEEASDIAERVRKAVARFSFDIGTDNPLAVTVSIGVAEWGGDPEKAASMIARADEALYASKNHGRNRVTIAAKPPG